MATARRGRERVSRRDDHQRDQEHGRVREQVRAGQDPRRPSRQPERDVEERLVDQIGKQRAEEERVSFGARKGTVGPGRDLLSDAEVAEGEHRRHHEGRRAIRQAARS